MKNGGDNNFKNLIVVGCIVVAAALFVLSTMRVPERGGETAGNPVQVDGFDEFTFPMESVGGMTEVSGGISDEIAHIPSEVSDEAAETPSEVQDEAAEVPSEVPDETAESSSEEVAVSAETILEEAQSAQWADAPQVQLYTFRNDRLLNQHYEKHGIEMGFATIEEYVAAANAVIYHPDVLHKQEAEDNDDVYFLEATNEFVVVSTDGYIRTYFIASGGIDYYNRQ
ncbi:MAG: hypothetical protein K2I21_06015 [Acetatifactor sp.]|nr:hypothetical protein [Acetatifactor sp.]